MRHIFQYRLSKEIVISICANSLAEANDIFSVAFGESCLRESHRYMFEQSLIRVDYDK